MIGAVTIQGTEENFELKTFLYDDGIDYICYPKACQKMDRD